MASPTTHSPLVDRTLAFQNTGGLETPVSHRKKSSAVTPTVGTLSCPPAQRTVDTPTITRGFDRILSACSKPKRGTPPPHQGLPSAHKARRQRKATGVRGATENRRPSTTGGAPSMLHRRKRALFASKRTTAPRVTSTREIVALATAGEGVVQQQAGGVERQDEASTVVPATTRGHDATPNSCASTPLATSTPPTVFKEMMFEDVPTTSPAMRVGGTPSAATSVDGDGAGVAVAAAGSTPAELTRGLPSRIITPSFGQTAPATPATATVPARVGVAGDSSCVGAGVGSQQQQQQQQQRPSAAGLVRRASRATVRDTPRSMMRMLSRKSATVNTTVKVNREADVRSTPRSMVRQFIRTGLKTGDLKADTPATRKRRALAKAKAKTGEGPTRHHVARAAQGPPQSGESTMGQRLLHVLLLLLVCLVVFVVLCNVSAPLRKAVQLTLFGRTRAVRYT